MNGKKEHRVSFSKSNNKWKVHDREDKAKTNVRAKTGEQITWEATDSDIYFQFPDASVFGEHTMMVEKGRKLTLTVGPNATSGEHHYAAFCYDDKIFAEGDSPPKIVIER